MKSNRSSRLPVPATALGSQSMRGTLTALVMLATFTGTGRARQDAPEAARWISRWDQGECQLIRAAGNPLTERLKITMTPGSGSVALWIWGAQRRPPRQGRRMRVTIALAPSGTIISSDNVQHNRERGHTLYLIRPIDDRYLSDFASAQHLQVDIDGAQILSMPVGNASAAFDVLRQCATDQLRTWGLDPGAMTALRERPKPSHPRGVPGFFSHNDYPLQALRSGHSGATVVRLDITPEGRVAQCSLLQSSGHRSLDEQTCDVILRRGRFHPALDSTGAPTTAPLVARVQWNVAR